MSSRPTPPSYKTRNWSDYNAALKKRGSLTIWFDPNMVWTLPPSGNRGRQNSYSDTAIQACLTMKVRSAWSTLLRHRSEHDVDPPDDGLRRRPSAADRPGLVGAGLQHAMPTPEVAGREHIPYRGSTGPPHLLIDSTGIKAEGEGEWYARKHGGPKRRLWRKIHLGIDEETLEVRAVEITESHVGDAPMLPELLDQIPGNQDIGSVTADGAYDTRKCHDAVADRSAHAVIPPRKNAKP